MKQFRLMTHLPIIELSNSLLLVTDGGKSQSSHIPYLISLGCGRTDLSVHALHCMSTCVNKGDSLCAVAEREKQSESIHSTLLSSLLLFIPPSHTHTHESIATTAQSTRHIRFLHTRIRVFYPPLTVSNSPSIEVSERTQRGDYSPSHTREGERESSTTPHHTSSP